MTRHPGFDDEVCQFNCFSSVVQKSLYFEANTQRDLFLGILPKLYSNTNISTILDNIEYDNICDPFKFVIYYLKDTISRSKVAFCKHFYLAFSF